MWEAGSHRFRIIGRKNWNIHSIVDGCTMQMRPLADKSDKYGNFLSVCLKRLSIVAVAFLTTTLTTALLGSDSSRSVALKSVNTPLEVSKPAIADTENGSSFGLSQTDAEEKNEGQDLSIKAFDLSGLNDENWHDYNVKLEGNLLVLSSKMGLNIEDAHAILALGGEVDHLNNLYRGDKLRINHSDENRIRAIEYDIHDAKRLRVFQSTANSGKISYQYEVVSRPLTKRFIRVSGKIRSSLYKEARAAGLTKQHTLQLIRIFDCNIDYSKDIKSGDSFAVIYEQQYRGSEKVADSQILAAEFRNDEKVYRAIRYVAPNDKPRYYTPDGISLHRTFLRNPVDYPMISSQYNPARKHPILHKIRAHKGVDYAAKRGTPIKATGDGFVKHIGRMGGYGKTIVIQHNDVQDTLYAHMYKYAKNLQVGDRIRQGDIIGFVGKSGRATGTHLHYEFHVSGKHVDPLKISYPTISVPENRIYEFFAKSQLLLSQLKGLEKVKVAWKESKKETSG